MFSATGSPAFTGGVAPFGDPRIILLPDTRGLSQVATSFIASRCQGIHHKPLVAWSKLLTVLRRFEESNLRLMQVLFLVTLAFNCQIAFATNVIQ